MKITKEDFDDWRHSRVTEYIFETVLIEHATSVMQLAMDAAWAGNETEEFMAACRAEHKILTQLSDLQYEDLVKLGEDDSDE